MPGGVGVFVPQDGGGAMLREKVADLVEALLRNRDLELVEIQLVPGRRQIVRLFVDRQGGVSVADCAELSRQISRKLETEPVVPGNYVLEVSSPGMNRTIWSLEHFRRFRGEPVRIQLREPQGGRRHFGGKIDSVEEDIVHIRLAEDEFLDVAVDQIETARLDMDPWKARR